MRDGIAHLELLLPPAPNGAPWLSDMNAHLSSTNWRMSANICVLFGGGHGVGMSQWCRAWGTGEWPPTASLQNFQPPSFVPVPLVCARDSALSRAVIAALAYTRCHTRAAVQGRPEFKGGVLSAPAQRPEGHGPRFVGSFVDVLASRAPQRMALLRRMSAAELLALNVHLLPPWWIHWSLRELVVPLLPSQRPGRVVATSACLAVPSLGRRSAGTTAWRRHAGRREGAAAPGRRQLPERAREYYERAMSLQLSANQNQSVESLANSSLQVAEVH